MAKRFIETAMFRKRFIRGLEAPYKTFYIYYITECDHAGVFDYSNLDIDSILLGFNLDKKSILKAFGNRLIDLGGKFFMPDFIEYQYKGRLNSENRVHKSVIDRLNSFNINTDTLSPLEGASKGHPSPKLGCKDKDKDKDKVQVQDKDKVQVRNVPTLEEFQNHCVQNLKTINPEWTAERAKKAAKLKYETWRADGWKDGFGKPIKNWKLKAMNSIKFEKPYSYGSKTKTEKIATWSKEL